MNGGMKSVLTTALRSPFCSAVYMSDKISEAMTDTKTVRTIRINVFFKQLLSLTWTVVVT
jgi:hypothetical protein